VSGPGDAAIQPCRISGVRIAGYGLACENREKVAGDGRFRKPRFCIVTAREPVA
jgi:hypothetical protein